MEPCIYTALCNDRSTNVTKNLGLSKREKEKWDKRLKQFGSADGQLFWQGKKVPTVQQLDEVLRPIHQSAGGKHCKSVNILCKAVSGTNFALPPFLGGIERACTL